MIKVEFTQNNSRGIWRIKEEGYLALEKAGWNLEWDSEDKGFSFHKRSGGIPKRATKVFENIQQALQEWEKITGKDCSDEGCNCCGPCYEFHWESIPKVEGEWNYSSGEENLRYLHGLEKIPTYRELVEEKVKKNG